MKNQNTAIAIATDRASGALGASVDMPENAIIAGWYHAVFRDAEGNVLREDKYPNLVTNVGKNYLLDNGLAGSAYTAAFFLGLISLVSYTAIAAADTMASHAGWTEAGLATAPAYSETTRRAPTWGAAASGSKAFSSGVVFTFTATGTVKGSFLTTVSTKDGTTGTLYSAGLFSGGDQPVVNTNTLTVTYTATLT